ncbi:MAG: hypothetical protein MH204_10450 [Fimbriimonadaceae bacterium]|nr:hypothetical protein [Fimbriimonadaceae bacterium]
MPLDASIIGYSVGIDPWVDALSRKQIGLLTPRPLAELPAEAIFLADRLWSTDRERPGTFRSPHGPSLNALAWSGGIRRRTVAEWGPQS